MKAVIFGAILFASISNSSVAQNTFPVSGNVGTGTTSPNAPLQIHVGSNQNIFFDSNSFTARISAVNDNLSINPPLSFQATSYNFYSNSAVRSLLYVSPSGIGIGTTNPPTIGNYGVSAINGGAPTQKDKLQSKKIKELSHIVRQLNHKNYK